MTPAHIFFIPSIFFLGFILEGLAGSRSRSDGSAIAGNTTHSGPLIRTLVIAFFVFASIFVATHMSPQFGGAKAVTAVMHGMPLFDQRPSFSSADVFQRLDAFGDAGRNMYQRFTYSVDIIFPLSLLVFLSLLARFVNQRVALSAGLRKLLLAIPAIWFSADMLENIIVYTLIAQFPAQNDLLGGSVGYVTVAKFSLLLLSIAGPAILIVARRRERAR